MLVLEGPEPGHYTDVCVWRDCRTRRILQVIMARRVAAGRPELKVYADKIYNRSRLVEAAYSRRRGRMPDWQHRLNGAMSGIRVGVEWSFGRLTRLFAFCDWWKVHQIQRSTVARFYIVSGLLSNCHNCLYGDIHVGSFDILPPTLAEYLAQRR